MTDGAPTPEWLEYATDERFVEIDGRRFIVTATEIPTYSEENEVEC